MSAAPGLARPASGTSVIAPAQPHHRDMAAERTSVMSFLHS